MVIIETIKITKECYKWPDANKYGNSDKIGNISKIYKTS